MENITWKVNGEHKFNLFLKVVRNVYVKKGSIVNNFSAKKILTIANTDLISLI